MRPRTILMFEGLMLGTLAVGWLQIALTWDQQMMRIGAATRSPTAFLLGIGGTVTALMLVLILLVSRRRSRVAAGILIVLFAIGIPGYVRTFINGAAFGYTPLAAVQVVGQLAAYALLFMPASRAWFRRREPQVDLRETFS